MGRAHSSKISFQTGDELLSPKAFNLRETSPALRVTSARGTLPRLVDGTWDALIAVLSQHRKYDERMT